MGEVVKALGRVGEDYRGAAEFNHLLWCRLNSHDPVAALQKAQADGTTPRRVLETLEKGAVAPGSLQPGNWASVLGSYRQIISAYVDSLSSFSFFDRARADNAFVPGLLGGKIAITTASAIGSVIAEGSVKPVSYMAFDAPTI